MKFYSKNISIDKKELNTMSLMNSNLLDIESETKLETKLKTENNLKNFKNLKKELNIINLNNLKTNDYIGEKNKIKYRKDKQLKNLYRAMYINNKEIYSFNQKDILINFQKNNIIKILLSILLENKYKYYFNRKMRKYQKIMLINNIRFSQINNTISLLEYNKNYSTLVKNSSKNKKNTIYITYYKGNWNSNKKVNINNKKSLDQRLNMFNYLISLSNTSKLNNLNQKLKFSLSSSSSLLPSSSLFSSSPLLSLSSLNNYDTIINTNMDTNTKLLNNQQIINISNIITNYELLTKNFYVNKKFSISNKLFLSNETLKFFLEYYLTIIYNNNVLIYLNEVGKPYLDPSILGKNLALSVTNKKDKLRKIKRGVILNNLLKRKLKFSKPILPKNTHQIRGKYLINLDRLNSSYLKDSSNIKYLKNLNNSKYPSNWKENWKEKKRNIKNFSDYRDYIPNNLKSYLQIKKNLDLRIKRNIGSKDSILLYNKIKFFLRNFIKFKWVLGIHWTLSGRFSRRKLANRAVTTKMYNGYSNYSINNVLNPFLKPKNNQKFNKDFIRIYTTNKNGAVCLKIGMNYTQ